MDYNAGNGTGIVDEVLKICGATTANYSLNDITRRVNMALDWYIHLASKVGKKWPFDDSNQTTPPLLTQAISSGVNKYKLTGFNGTLLYTNKLSVTDSAGNGHALTPEEFIELDFITNYDTAITGIPSHYLKLGDYFYLRPTPGYSGTLTSYSVRPSVYMTASGTAIAPGIPVIHHGALCRKAALPYLIENKLPQAGSIATLLQKDEREILEYFGYRNNDMPSRFSPLIQNNR